MTRPLTESARLAAQTADYLAATIVAALHPDVALVADPAPADSLLREHAQRLSGVLFDLIVRLDPGSHGLPGAAGKAAHIADQITLSPQPALGCVTGTGIHDAHVPHAP
ncbi:hypothetical protein QRX60_28575 [Amycolatopsis mongoliensis]|uniref:Uncharacterized protein n=1 Tax=Amycolatopsis mongoliensis TaxID=715475 RepID=A0A9Y2JIQ2_9PSEU|nr:hypothetical protein [Amycolatopsis sp. 4-36]WIX98028.1 hypothetical protein QRX60_28575 [Amycolatopsis sp. 4-36]